MPATQYYLQENILSIEKPGGPNQECLYVPAGTVVSVLERSEDHRFVEVEWEARRVLMFDVDIQQRALPLSA